MSRALRWYALQCPTCGRWRSARIAKMVRFVMMCFRCHSRTKVHQNARGGLYVNHVGPLESSVHARFKVAALNAGKEVRA